jgi:hypothetical protein
MKEIEPTQKEIEEYNDNLQFKHIHTRIKIQHNYFCVIKDNKITNAIFVSNVAFKINVLTSSIHTYTFDVVCYAINFPSMEILLGYFYDEKNANDYISHILELIAKNN